MCILFTDERRVYPESLCRVYVFGADECGGLGVSDEGVRTPKK